MSRNIREEILIAAGDLVQQKGVKATTLKDIAEKVGISKGTLYYHFASKDDIVFEIADQYLSRFTNNLEEWIGPIGSDTSVEEVLQVVIENIAGFEARGKLHLYLISEAIMGNEGLRQRFKLKYEEWLILVEDTLKRVVQVTPAELRVLSHLVVAMIDGFSMQKLVGVEAIPMEDAARKIVCQKM